MFSYGKSKNFPYPILHAVISDPAFIGVRPAEVISDKGMVLKMDISRELCGTVRKLLPPPFCFHQQQVRIIVINAIDDKVKPGKGSPVTIEMARQSRFLQPTKEENSDVGAVIVLGHMTKCDEYQLLLCRFFVEEPVIGSSFEDYESVLNTTTVWEA